MMRRRPIILISFTAVEGWEAFAIGEPVADELFQALQDPELPRLTRQYAALALGKIGTKDREVLPALTKALNHEQPAIQQAAARALAASSGTISIV